MSILSNVDCKLSNEEPYSTICNRKLTFFLDILQSTFDNSLDILQSTFDNSLDILQSTFDNSLDILQSTFDNSYCLLKSLLFTTISITCSRMVRLMGIRWL